MTYTHIVGGACPQHKVLSLGAEPQIPRLSTPEGMMSFVVGEAGF